MEHIDPGTIVHFLNAIFESSIIELKGKARGMWKSYKEEHIFFRIELVFYVLALVSVT